MNRFLKKRLFIVLILFVLAAVAAHIGVHRYARHTAVSALDQIVNTVPWIHSVTFGSIHVDIVGEGMEMEDVAVTLAGASRPVHIDRVVVHSMDRNHLWPFRMYVECHGIRLSPEHVPDSGALFHQLGYDALTGRLECAYRYDHPTKTLSLERLHVEVADAGTVTLSARVGNIDLLEIFSGHTEGANVAGRLGGMLIERGDLRYVDASLFDRALQVLARSSGVSTNVYRRQLARRIAILLTTDPRSDVGRIGAALSSFLKRPIQLFVSVAPDRPTALFWLLWFRDLEKLVDQLGLQVSTAPNPNSS